MVVLAALSLIGLIVSLLNRDALASSFRTSSRNLSPSGVDNAVNAAIAVSVVLGIIFIVLYLLLARQLSRGKNWARVVTLVLAALSLLSTLSALVQTRTGSGKVLSVISALVNVALIVLLLRPDSKAYFARR